jgi:hypothetical protein
LIYSTFPNVLLYHLLKSNLRSLTFLRIFFTLVNEAIIFAVIFCTNLGENGLLDLIVNFSAASIISELDNHAMSIRMVEEIKIYFNKLNEQKDKSGDPDSQKDSLQSYKVDLSLSECGFLKIMVHKNKKQSYFLQTTHLFFCLFAAALIFYKEEKAIYSAQFLNGAIRSGSHLTASSSWLPLYPM